MNRSNLREAFVALFNPRTIVPFVLGAVFLGVLGSAVYTVITNILGNSTATQVGIALTMLIGLLTSALMLTWLAGQPAGGLSLTNVRAPAKSRGLICLVSQRATCEAAVSYHLPELKRLWLVCSAQTNAIATQIASELSDQHGIQVEIRQVQNVHDLRECYQRIWEILARLPEGYNVEDVIGDYTGMNKHASIGLTLACLHFGSPLQYTPEELNAEGRGTGRSLAPFEVVLRNRPVPADSTVPPQTVN